MLQLSTSKVIGSLQNSDITLTVPTLQHRVVLQVGIWSIIALLWWPFPVVAQEKKNDILDGLLSSFALPLEDLLHKKQASEWRNLLDGLNVGGAFSYPLKKSQPQASQGRGSQGE